MSANFSVGYGAGGVAGQAFKDRVTVGEATVSSQIIGAANITSGFSLVQPIDGIRKYFTSTIIYSYIVLIISSWLGPNW